MGRMLTGRVMHKERVPPQPATMLRNKWPFHTYLASILHVVLLSRMRAGAGCALFGATQDDGILVQVPSPLHHDTDRPRLLTDIIARGTQKSRDHLISGVWSQKPGIPEDRQFSVFKRLHKLIKHAYH